MARVNYICLHIFLKLEYFLVFNSCMHYSDWFVADAGIGLLQYCNMGSTCSYFTTSIIQFQNVILENLLSTCWLSVTLCRCRILTDSAERNMTKGYPATFGKFTNKDFYLPSVFTVLIWNKSLSNVILLFHLTKVRSVRFYLFFTFWMGNFSKTTFGKPKEETTFNFRKPERKRVWGGKGCSICLSVFVLFFFSGAPAKQQTVSKKRTCIYNRIVWEQINSWFLKWFSSFIKILKFIFNGLWYNIVHWPVETATGQSVLLLNSANRQLEIWTSHSN